MGECNDGFCATVRRPCHLLVDFGVSKSGKVAKLNRVKVSII
jgi:hypothetical protein